MAASPRPVNPRRRYRCLACGAILNAWLPVAKRPNGAMLLYHLGQHHPDQVKPYLQRMETECITTVVIEAYDMVEEN